MRVKNLIVCSLVSALMCGAMAPAALAQAVEQGQTSARTKLGDLKQRRDGYSTSLKLLKSGEDDKQIEQLIGYIEDVDAMMAEIGIRALAPQVKVYALRHAQARDAVHVLETVLEGEDNARVGVDMRTNRLIVSATEAAHEHKSGHSSARRERLIVGSGGEFLGGDAIGLSLLLKRTPRKECRLDVRQRREKSERVDSSLAHTVDDGCR